VNKRDFIRAHTRLAPVPLTPEIRLYSADDSTALWIKTEAELRETGLPPPFWAFPWAGGQALARHVLDNPGLVRGKLVLDVASGSGLVAIAAAKAGAAVVEACEIDAFAAAAIAMNAEENGVDIKVRLEDLTGRDEGWDAALAGDIAYERDMAGAMADWLGALAGRGAVALIGDPGRAYLPRDRLARLAEYDVPVSRDIEDSDVKRSSVWRFASASNP
jgi:predicted nicotinamide N-methyase